MKGPIGVITEQGFPAGKFGYEPLNENDQKKVSEEEEPKKK